MHDEKGRFTSKGYHATNKDFDPKNISLDYFGETDLGSYGKGIYLSPNMESVKKYGNKFHKYEVKDLKMANLEKFKEVSLKYKIKTNLLFKNKEEYEKQVKEKAEKITDELIKMGYDGVNAKDQFVIYDPKKLKYLETINGF